MDCGLRFRNFGAEVCFGGPGGGLGGLERGSKRVPKGLQRGTLVAPKRFLSVS